MLKKEKHQNPRSTHFPYHTCFNNLQGRLLSRVLATFECLRTCVWCTLHWQRQWQAHRPLFFFFTSLWIPNIPILYNITYDYNIMCRSLLFKVLHTMPTKCIWSHHHQIQLTSDQRVSDKQVQDTERISLFNLTTSTNLFFWLLHVQQISLTHLKLHGNRKHERPVTLAAHWAFRLYTFRQ